MGHQNLSSSKRQRNKHPKLNHFSIKDYFSASTFIFLKHPSLELNMWKVDFQTESCVLWKEKGKVFEIFSIHSASCNRENLILAQFQSQTMPATHNKCVSLKWEVPVAAFRCGLWFWKSTFLQRKYFVAGSQLLGTFVLNLLAQLHLNEWSWHLQLTDIENQQWNHLHVKFR